MILFNLALRQLTASKRWLVFCLLAAVPLLLSSLERMASGDQAYLQEGFPSIVIGVLVPMIALLLAGSVFASDIEEGTAALILSKPVPRSRILLERFAATAVLALLVTEASALLSIVTQAGRVQNIGSLVAAAAAAVAVGSVVYSAIFLALSLVTRRGIMIGLMYVLVWENTLAGQFAGTRSLSVKEYMLTIMSSIDRTGLAQHTTTLTPHAALAMGAALLALALTFALLKLRRYEVTEQM